VKKSAERRERDFEQSQAANRQKSRRRFLRGTGVALALPWLESLNLLKAQDLPTKAAAAAANKPPVRFATVYFSNGVQPPNWWAKGSGKDMQFGPAGAPLNGYGADLNFIHGLFNHAAFINPSPHLGRCPNMLSGAPVSMDPTIIQCGTTFDQVLSQKIGRNTLVPSMVLGIEPNELRLEDGMSMLYGSAISWASPTRPATKEIYPARAFDQLVGDGSARRLDRSILDELMGEANALRPKISTGDKVKLNEYLESVRDIEVRLDRSARRGTLEGWRPTIDKPNMQRPPDEIPQVIPDHMRLMLDLMVLAFQMDKTRIMTIMLNNDLSQMNMKFLEGVSGALHLDLTHNNHVPALEAMYLKTNQYHMKEFTYLLDRLKAIDEGGQSILDSSILMLMSNLYDGDKHGADQMPIVTAGSGGGSLKTGRILDYLDKGDDNRRACSLYLSIMDRMGVQLDRFGDSDKRLADI
jgi:hypothetical protein